MSRWISALDLWLWPTIALVLFMTAAAAITYLIIHMGRRQNLQQLAERVLRDEPSASVEHPNIRRNSH